MRCFSAQHGSYWWPRRKITGSTGCRFILQRRREFVRRSYSGQAAERRSINPATEVPFEESFYPNESNNIPAMIPGERMPDPRSAAMVKESCLEEMGEHLSNDNMNVERQTHQISSSKETRRAEETTKTEEVDVTMENPDGSDIEVATTPIHDSESGVESANSHTSTAFDIMNEAIRHPVEGITKQAIITAVESDIGANVVEDETPQGDVACVENALRAAPAMLAATKPELDVEVPLCRKIYILGTGPTGKFIAHSLAGLAHPPPVTLLMHRPLLMQQWHEEGGKIRILRNGNIVTKSDFNIESSANFQKASPHQGYPAPGQNLDHSVVEHLIVTTDGNRTISALLAIKNRLRYSSTICFIQNGLGIVDKVNSLVFPDLASRPSYLLGNISHDLQSTERKFTLVEKGAGTISLTMIPRTFGIDGPKRDLGKTAPLIRKMDFGWTAGSKYLMRTLSRTPELGVTGLTRERFYKLQLESLAINSVIGPLSVIYDCSNDQLLYNYEASRSMKLLLKEISLILKQLPEVSRVAKIEEHFSAKRLERVIVSVIGKTGKNLTSMLKAVRMGQKTDIDFYNGYLLKRAAELGIDCPRLDMIVSMVKGKQAMKSRERNSYIPFRDEY